MKKILMILVGVLILFTLTNPSMNDFEKYVDNMTQSKIDEKTGLEKATETLKQSSLGSLYKVCARKSNYILFSTYMGLASISDKTHSKEKSGQNFTFLPTLTL